ncbi:hypothetical protein [Enterococcus cecorum]|uniref:Uncharacterized protein n=1 Tax=Enterococcus cecorum DSM 20682 = ATCC 43198 TaxID=1121864 RepID=S1QW61_9ENTE|nr:hypothetical protein [Enterococcus cecorum]EOX17956.1 hypothetical protein I567_01917 [Enterococcus cecorum DSM 20682 = ATCC 43198]ESK62686.1 hypothetical protein OMO_00335 [Enterococcus cecorum DSM 20682 = ATCC 43198]OJG34783.1 hypothetical protein RT42_GL000189 [Enterococcus cecorum DSM 20682 = ATCC 43198]CAI3367934.1 hypothetical protein CIRMBP1318_00626 [Enterococcus cecorum DSM 20682 = ATCC 43198]SQE54856.1 Uncharacterised protein [Enterococcus cecorum]
MKNVTAKNETKISSSDIVKMLKSKLKKRKSVEKENPRYSEICGGSSQADVLYSFLGIYALGVWVYNKKKNQDINDFQSEIRKKLRKRMNEGINQHFYSTLFQLAIQDIGENDEIFNDVVEGRVSAIKSLEINVDTLNKNDELQRFISNYSSVGNVIPIWPGGNELKGKSGVFDIPELFFAKYREWYNVLLDLTGDFAYLDKFNQDFNCNFEKYESLDKFLNSISSIKEYTKYLEHVNEIIDTRTKLINEKLLNMK